MDDTAIFCAVLLALTAVISGGLIAGLSMYQAPDAFEDDDGWHVASESELD